LLDKIAQPRRLAYCHRPLAIGLHTGFEVVINLVQAEIRAEAFRLYSQAATSRGAILRAA
jgi:hypothetical protein